MSSEASLTKLTPEGSPNFRALAESFRFGFRWRWCAAQDMIGDDLRKTVKDQGCKSQLSNFIRSCGLSTSKGIAGGDTPRRNGSPALSAVMIARSANTCKHLSMGLLCGLGNQAMSSLCVKLSLVIRCPCWLRQGSPGRSQFFSRIAPQVSGLTTAETFEEYTEYSSSASSETTTGYKWSRGSDPKT